MSTNKTLITGAAGFIRFHLAQRLLAQGDQVCGLDNMNDYYDVNLKKDRLKLLESQKNFTFIKADIADRTPNGGQTSNLSPPLSVISLRSFTVYGPWGRPDMAYFSFTKAILDGTPIKVFNYGELKQDFTYIDDVGLKPSTLN